MTITALEGELETTTAAAIETCIYGDFMSISAVRYLFRLNPAPAFVCSTNHKTLLISAVSGPAACWCIPIFMRRYILTGTDQISLDYVGHEICRMVLENYPELENLSKGEGGFDAVHAAANSNNIVALQRTWAHVERQHRACNLRSDPADFLAKILNTADDRCGTALDYCTQIFFPSRPQHRLHASRRFSTTFDDRRAAALKCYEWLREHGALHKMELSGFCVEYGQPTAQADAR